ncbi:MAG: hypothetical protein NTY19_04715 [Planctomycetota bacterium]|nr:hypothetical protein [Planctomycetota bacterium]
MTTAPTIPPKPRRRWLQFSLRTMLALTVVLGCGFGWLGTKVKAAKEQDGALQALSGIGAVRQDYPSEVPPKWRALIPEDLVPRWARDNLFDDVTGLTFTLKDGFHAWGPIGQNPGCVDGSLVPLARLPDLRFVGLAGTHITDNGLRHLTGLRSLECLNLGLTSVSDAGLMHLKPLVNLERLILANTQVTDAGLVQLKDRTRLQVLVLGNDLIVPPHYRHRGQIQQERLTRRKKWFPWTTRITDAGLLHIRALTRLRQLDLCSTGVTDAGLIHLNTLTMLKSLAISNTQVTDAGLVHLREFAELEHLDVSNTLVTDAGLEDLRTLTKLQELDLAGTKVTDGGLVHLADLMSLRQLWLEDTSVSDDGVMRLRKLLPNLEVLDPRGITWKPLAMFPDTGEARLP